MGTFRGESAFTTWLLRIAHNTAITRSTQQVRRSETFTGEDDHSPDDYEASEPLPDDILEARNLQDRLARHIDTLPEHYRVALVLYYYQDRSYQELAEILDRPMNTVKAHLRRAKAQLKKLLLAYSTSEDW